MELLVAIIGVAVVCLFCFCLFVCLFVFVDDSVIRSEVGRPWGWDRDIAAWSYFGILVEAQVMHHESRKNSKDKLKCVFSQQTKKI